MKICVEYSHYKIAKQYVDGLLITNRYKFWTHDDLFLYDIGFCQALGINGIDPKVLKCIICDSVEDPADLCNKLEHVGII